MSDDTYRQLVGWGFALLVLCITVYTLLHWNDWPSSVVEPSTEEVSEE